MDGKREDPARAPSKDAGAGIARGRRSDDAPAYLIQRTARLLRVLFLRVVDTPDSGVTPEMWLVLSRLLAWDGRPQAEIAGSLFRDAPNVSRILSGLEKQGLARREPDPVDRRKVRVHITPAGRAFVERTAPRAAEVRDRLYEGIGKKRLEEARATIRRIEENALGLLAELAELDEAVASPSPAMMPATVGEEDPGTTTAARD
ncbi:MAG: MarR family transcriptional regulator [Gemmatimonadota bacterium]